MTTRMILAGTLDITLALAALFWVLLAVRTRLRIRRQPYLRPPAAPADGPADAPLVSIILPARNEERNIERCLRTLMAQDYPRIEIIVIDDRSTDRTAEIVRHLQQEDPRIRLLAGEPLPPGWVGQPFGNCQGVAVARGEWFLFTDADTDHAPHTLRAAMAHCREHGVEFLSLYPILECGNFWERAIQPFIFWLVWMRYPPERVNDPKDPAAEADGIFILISRKSYDRIGGWAAVRDCIPDDMAFVEWAKSQGVPVHLLLGTPGASVRVRMYQTIAELWEGWTRYFLTGMKQNIPLAVAAFGFFFAFNLLPFLVVLGWPPARLLGAGGSLLPPLLAATAAVAALDVRRRVNRLFDVSPAYALAHPLSSLFLLGVIVACIYGRLTGRGVRWKGRTYGGGRPGLKLREDTYRVA